MKWFKSTKYAAVVLSMATAAVMADTPELESATAETVAAESEAVEAPAAPAAPEAPASTEAVEAPAAPDAPAEGGQVSPEAQVLLDQLLKSYSELNALKLVGSMHLEMKAPNQNMDQTTPFESSYKRGGMFRHEVDSNLLVGSTAKEVYIYEKNANIYLLRQIDGELTEEQVLPPVRQILIEQNPSLLFAFSSNVLNTVSQSATTLSRGEDITIGDGTYSVLVALMPDGRTIRFAVDPKTGLIRQVIYDLTGMLASRGVPDVEKAQATIDYSTVDAGVELTDESFAWAPPADAKDASKIEQGGGQQEYPAMQLEGKAAPAFKLNDLDGNEVTLESLKGQVVFIDFWASWCGPCRQSLPETVALSKELAPKGLKAFAINVGEDQPTAKSASDELKIEIPVLLDTQRVATQAYAANAIPMAVVIGKDGNVRKVFIGMTDPQIMRTAIEAALAE